MSSPAPLLALNQVLWSGLDLVCSQVPKLAEGELALEQLWMTLPNSRTSLHWSFGHLATVHDVFLRSIGGEGILPLEDWRRLFGRGTGHDPDRAAEYPPLEELVRRFQDVHRKVGERLAIMDEAALQAEPGAPFTGRFPNLAAMTQFICFHHSYHVGQMNLLRRVLGMPSTIGLPDPKKA